MHFDLLYVYFIAAFCLFLFIAWFYQCTGIWEWMSHIAQTLRHNEGFVHRLNYRFVCFYLLLDLSVYGALLHCNFICNSHCTVSSMCLFFCV